MKKIFMLWFLCGANFLAAAQITTIKDQETGEPLEFVSLTSETPQAHARTNAEGQTNLSAFKSSQAIRIFLVGYKPLLKSYDELKLKGFSILMERSNLQLEKVVISANKWQQSTDYIPFKIATITPKSVALQNPQTAADLLSSSGKVYVQKSQQGGGSPMIRGFATNRLLYTVDGIRMNTAIFRGGNIQNVINLDPFATENTEVLFGPGSVIYGSDAIGGTMSFQTLTPQFSYNDEMQISGKAISRYASANQEKTGHFDVNVGWKKWAAVTSFSAWDFDHLRQGRHGPKDYIKPYYVQRQDSMDRIISQDDPLLQIPSAYSQMNIMQKIRFSPNKNWDLQYGFHYSETSPYGRYDRHNRMRNGTARYAEWNYGPQSWQMHHLSIEHLAQHSFYDQMNIRLARQSFGESRIERSLNSDTRTTNSEEVIANSVNLDFKKKIGKEHVLFYGLEYVNNDVNSFGQLTNITNGNITLGPARYPNAQWTSMATYINGAFDLSKKFKVQGGFRYNQYILDANFSNNAMFYPFPFEKVNINRGALTGSLGAVYRPEKSWIISLNAGTAFRSPNVDDIGKIFDSEPGAVTVPNRNLTAEYAYNADIGVAKIIAEKIKIDASAYYTILNNALVRRNFQFNGQDSIIYDGQLSKVQAIQNAAQAHVYGVQLGLEIKLPTGFSFSSDLNYQKGEEEMDDGTISASRHAAPLFGVSRFNFRKKKLDIQVYSTYQGTQQFKNLAVEEQHKDEIYAKDANGNNYVPAWYTINIKALYNINKNLSFSTSIENITDQRYRTYSSGLSAPGRNFIMSLSCKF